MIKKTLCMILLITTLPTHSVVLTPMAISILVTLSDYQKALYLQCASKTEMTAEEIITCEKLKKEVSLLQIKLSPLPRSD
ncbi:hypothetical protein PVK64_18155 [Aliivibrio sp. S4TY2]|uniref:hypothetical protein n=1 Tax=unclassified Aliivibrio TaxID=2645654 RepID=UPI00237946A9|nr:MULTISPECIES: hypothetical protein [unclassified Aliivibrio]MDD9158088.1 hypothetical protein [Aliivibrio sp. S4TY2]MDD9162003.1 hypothetical protein [Aliivibrio sp. S4TY1]MDD9166085.1 hypothetical protein [Aliivibrio sp. S4MY2]MDD9170083.1 hypothetical protein [Aliivibrio sp. S4MY4]MDD9187111.1 hypothetical protein [Aliivibrio sp. S4MY3]